MFSIKVLSRVIKPYLKGENFLDCPWFNTENAALTFKSNASLHVLGCVWGRTSVVEFIEGCGWEEGMSVLITAPGRTNLPVIVFKYGDV